MLFRCLDAATSIPYPAHLRARPQFSAYSALYPPKQPGKSTTRASSIAAYPLPAFFRCSRHKFCRQATINTMMGVHGRHWSLEYTRVRGTYRTTCCNVHFLRFCCAVDQPRTRLIYRRCPRVGLFLSRKRALFSTANQLSMEVFSASGTRMDVKEGNGARAPPCAEGLRGPFPYDLKKVQFSVTYYQHFSKLGL